MKYAHAEHFCPSWAREVNSTPIIGFQYLMVYFWPAQEVYTKYYQ